MRKSRLYSLAFWVIGALLPLLPSVQGGQNADCGALLTALEDAYAEREDALVRELADQVMRSDVSARCTGEVYLLLGRSLNRNGTYDSARYYLVMALEIGEQQQAGTLMGEAHYWLGRSYRSSRIYDRAALSLLRSLEVFDSLTDRQKYARSINAIANLYDDKGDVDLALEYRRSYVEQMEKVGNERRQTIAQINLATTLVRVDSIESKAAFLKARLSRGAQTYDDLSAVISQNLGVLYSEKFRQYDSAIYHFEEARAKYLQQGVSVLDININLGALKEYQEDLRGAEAYYLEALQEIENLQDMAYEKVIYANLSGLYERWGNYWLAYDFEKKLNEVSSRLLDEEKNKAIVEAETRYQTSEKEKQILALERNNERAEFRRQRAVTITWVVGLALFIVALTAYFTIKNYRARRLIAEQRSKLDKQRVVELMRQQELVGFDAMVLGQNNERKRIAEALHDHLGSLMATLKLGFESFWFKFGGGDDKASRDYQRLIGQIDEACDEVRRVSHDTRSGVLMSEGLLPAIKKLAGNISQSGGLTIEVTGFELDKGLEGSIELGVYRIIQELLTNIIKHAEADRSTVQLTMHEGSLNVLIEDNGKGFDPDKQHDGVGLKSIRSRVSYLHGELIIDSHIGKGTTVSIDIPVK